MNKYVIQQPIEALLWCNNIGDMMSFISTLTVDVRIDMNVKEHGYGVENLKLFTCKGELIVRESIDYVVKGVDGDVYIVGKSIFDTNFKLAETEPILMCAEETRPVTFNTQPHKM